MQYPEIQYHGESDPERLALENRYLEIEILPQKGSDIVTITDRQSNENILFEAPHNWQLPGSYSPSVATNSDWLDYYPGGWQDCLPFGGEPTEIRGAQYGMHGESALLPWEWEVKGEGTNRVEVTFSCDLVRYPFHVERTIRLEENERKFSVIASISNEGNVELPFNWLQHICFGPPLIDPDATVSIPGGTVTVAEEPQGTSPLPWGETFSWPTAPDGTDLREIPALDSGIHDLFYIHELPEGWYAIRNHDLGVDVTVSFDETLFEALWCWRSFEGIEESPFFSRERVFGIEPATGWPSSGLPESQGSDGTDTLKTIEADETIETVFELAITEIDDEQIDG